MNASVVRENLEVPLACRPFLPGRRGGKVFERTREQNNRLSLTMELQVKT
jgi:hypothetical protein